MRVLVATVVGAAAILQAGVAGLILLYARSTGTLNMPGAVAGFSVLVISGLAGILLLREG